MKNKKLITALFVVGCCSFSMAQMSFSFMDKNGDGVVQEQEFYEAQAKNMEQKAAENKMMRNAANAPQFSDIDLNQDGKVTQKELNQFRSKRMMENRSKKSGFGKNKGGKGMGQNR